jgi:hypothetical protein
MLCGGFWPILLKNPNLGDVDFPLKTNHLGKRSPFLRLTAQGMS